ncbi:MAG: class I SAM-dependent methyltransferase [Myxococcota bacterium]|nr:class I SAM-dependent methyltransferase [Deltaproteobacteria bacterium]MDQ3336707.1 class I SAM-dependent methyltransferase [Myxococcota bacterium]
MKQLWEDSFDEQIARGAYNTAPVEALIRSTAYWLRDQQKRPLHFLEMGCGAGPTLVWLAQKGITVSGIDIATNALELARQNLTRNGYTDRIGELTEGSVVKTPFADESFDGILESCVFQHIPRAERIQTFGEVARLLKPGGLFVGHMLAEPHTTFQKMKDKQLADDSGSLHLADGSSKIHLTNIGLAHFFKKDEFAELLPGFSVVDPCLTTYYLPKAEAKKRGYDEYLQAMWTVVAIK